MYIKRGFMEIKRELIRKEYLLWIFSLISFIVLISMMSANTITIVSPASYTNWSGRTLVVFNVSYANLTDYSDALNATFYYNLSGVWTYINYTTDCNNGATFSSCNITLNVSALTQGRFSINATLGNDSVYGASIITSNVVFDWTPPNVTIIPSNNTNTSNTLFAINYTRLDNIFLSSCWYSNDSFSINNTLANCGNITGVTWIEGAHNIRLYANDSAGNINTSSIRFTVDTIKPNLTIIYPSNNTNTSNSLLAINYTRLDNIFLSSCWYSNDSFSMNTSIANCANITGVTWINGAHNIRLYANDSAGNINVSAVRFTVDTIAPSINITFPLNNTNTTNTNLDINYTVSDSLTAISSCWYSNDSYSVNNTLANCENITGVTWATGLHNLTIWVNDSAGNVNSSGVSFNMSQSDITAPTATFSCSPSTVNRGNVVTCSCEPIDSESGVNTSATVYDINPPTNQIGILTVYCYFADLTGNAGSVSTTYFVFDPGGAGLLKPKITPSAVSAEILEKIESWEKITPNVPEIMKDFDKDMGVKQIQIEVIDEAQNVQIKVTGYGSKPANLSASKDETYKYLHIETQNLTDKLSKAVIDIQVEKSWISENNLNKENVALFKFNETSNQWKELTTTFKEEDYIYNYYNVELKSFSYFAIASKEIKRGILSILIWIIFAIVILAGIVFFSIINKNRIKKFLKIK